MLDSIIGEQEIDEDYVLKVRAKELNGFLGLFKTDASRLAIEAFPAELNQKLVSM